MILNLLYLKVITFQNKYISEPFFLCNTKVFIYTFLFHYFLSNSCQLARQMQNVLGEDSVQQRIAFLCPNDVSYVITQWATWMAGHIGKLKFFTS